ncbi:5-formyltetrahydrofolate cyclo-ligase [Lottiidibacillus patelloidae]|uniref:5-formyltetrahydrofolate cyclo-ligase n=1 Tax=Lottiidibacillus patelloidae TaxID=2670334 RepID=A0A263BWI6_9BACI|nr:5-formyltetrahydrofolate cyclo-ligase [Lottiidibacillus patelloidae]OZM57687.1 5-formyltetrahydrofolate cyclo-ligase [Lottiidibacillus patelloidae]
MKEIKTKYRKLIKKRLEQMSDSTYESTSKKITSQLFTTEEWKEANTIGVTISVGREINTKHIIEKAWQEGKKVTIPQALWETKQLQFRFITSYNQIIQARLGLFEPIIDQTNAAIKEEINLLIVPGLLFSIDGYRIGYGGGFYDRYLENFSGNTISLSFDFQLLSWLPHDRYDIPVKKIITDRRSIINDY